jgi:hypothetical protein
VCHCKWHGGRQCIRAHLTSFQLEYPGGLPAAWSASTAFPKLGELLLRPGNAEMCGPLPATTYTVQYMSSSGAAFPLTGTLGSCAQACGSLTTSSNATNLFDISVEAQVRLACRLHDALSLLSQLLLLQSRRSSEQPPIDRAGSTGGFASVQPIS